MGRRREAKGSTWKVAVVFLLLVAVGGGFSALFTWLWPGVMDRRLDPRGTVGDALGTLCAVVLFLLWLGLWLRRERVREQARRRRRPRTGRVPIQRLGRATEGDFAGSVVEVERAARW